jgi:hypothetical protein
VLQFHFNWKTLSVIAGVTLWNFYFQIFEQSIKSEQIIEFLQHLLRYIPGNLLLIWDRLHFLFVVQSLPGEQGGVYVGDLEGKTKKFLINSNSNAELYTEDGVFYDPSKGVTSCVWTCFSRPPGLMADLAEGAVLRAVYPRGEMFASHDRLPRRISRAATAKKWDRFSQLCRTSRLRYPTGKRRSLRVVNLRVRDFRQPLTASSVGDRKPPL